MVRFITGYIKKTEHYSAERFIAAMIGLEIASLIIMNLSLYIFTLLGVDLVGDYNWEIDIIDNHHWLFALIILCVLGPFFETILFQLIPIAILSRWINNRVVPIIISAVIFTVLHSYPPFLLIFIFFSGLFYAWSITVFRKEGCISSVIITSIIHGLTNLIAFVLYITG